MASSIVTAFQFGFIGTLLFGDKINAIATSQIFRYISERKMLSGIMAFFGCNMLNNALLSTGAF